MKRTIGPGRPSLLAGATGAAFFLVVAASVASLPVLLPSCRQSSSPSTHTVKRDRILISTIKRGHFKEAITVTGKILPINIVYLDALEGGRVDKVFVEARSLVKQGDQILQLTNTNLVMDIMIRETELFQQSNNLRNTRLSMEQFKLQLKQQL